MRNLRALTAVLALGLVTTACSTIGEKADDSSSPGAAPHRVVLVTHESFVLPKELIAQFEEQSGYDLVVRASGDAGALTNKLVLTQGNPTGDVAFGVDNTFASRALDADVFAPYDARLPAGADNYALPGDDEHRLTPVDNASVCVNVDDTWFKAHHLAAPRTLDDLTEPAYQDLFVLPGAATSSTGMAFLLATVAAYGDGWSDYWADLMDNGAKLTAGWSDAYEVDFTQGGGKGDRPIVLSYDSSPAFTVPKGSRTSTTHALLDTCFRQIEYAGVLDGAANRARGRRRSSTSWSAPRCRRRCPRTCTSSRSPTGSRFRPSGRSSRSSPTTPYSVDPADIAEHRDEWLHDVERRHLPVTGVAWHADC